ncbi:MAG: ABC-type transport auxiliary lipoprotein family protein [Desulfoprunum sp.]|nr:ABC-type transport auxiliary lipoprotein family protein [Desulfoprunum sp.]
MITLSSQHRLCHFGAMALVASLLCGCSMLLPAKSPTPTLYSFDSPQPVGQTVSAAPVKMGAPTLIVSIPRAASGFDSQQIIYIRQAHTFEYFRQSQWADAPAGMILPLIVAALERSGQFSAVIQSPTSAVGQLRLDVEIVRLQHEFLTLPSQAHFTLRAHLLDTATRQVVAWREFDTIVPSASEDPYGGVLAANSAVRLVIEQLALFCGQTAGNLPKIQP